MDNNANVAMPLYSLQTLYISLSRSVRSSQYLLRAPAVIHFARHAHGCADEQISSWRAPEPPLAEDDALPQLCEEHKAEAKDISLETNLGDPHVA
jgi:hypothetical protein